MALDGLGLAGGLIATGVRLGCGLGDLRLGPRYRCGLGLNDGRLDLLNLGRFLHGGLCGSLGLIHRGSGNRFRFGNCPMFNLGLNSFFGHAFLLLCALLRGGLGVAIGTLQQGFLRVEGFLVLCTLHGDPGAVAREAAGLHVVAQLHAHVFVHQGAAGGVEHGEGDLHAVLGVARHHVGRAQIDHVRVHAKGVNARMLQKASDDRTDMHVLGLARNARLEARDAADDHVYADSCARCLSDLVDDLAVGERVELKEHTGGLASEGTLDLAIQAAHNEWLQADRRHAQEAVIAAQVAQRQVAEEQVGVLADAGMGGHEHKVAVELGRLLVKVAGAQQRQACKRHALAIGELADLGVALKAFGAVDDGAACLFQTLGPLDVVLLVEAGAELHEHRDLFAVLGGIDQRLAQAALLGHAVERDAQRDALGVVGGLVYQIQEGVHGLIGIKEQFVVLKHLLADGAGHIDGGVGLRLKWRKEQLVAQVLGNLALNAKDIAQVERDIAGKDRATRELERLADSLERLLLE